MDDPTDPDVTLDVRTGPSGPRAGFWTRFAAMFIDGVVLGAIQTVVWLASNLSAAQLVGLFLSAGYFTYLEGGPKGQTLGKQLMNIRVIDFVNGGPLGYGLALIRWIGRIVSAFALLLGYFWMLGDRERQTWHDKFATSVVVPVKAYPIS